MAPVARAQTCDPMHACCAPPSGGATCGGVASPASFGSGPQTDVGVGNPINLITGNKYQSEVDLAALPGVLGLEIVRHYNSATSGLQHATGIFGRGWRLSYETELAVKGAGTLEITQADGSPITFNKTGGQTATQDNTWASANPAQGHITSRPTARGTEYRWRWAGAAGSAGAGRELLFDARGKLIQISAPTGEFVTLRHDPQGWLVQVTDPQGRSLHLNYLDKATTRADRADNLRNNQRFRGVQSIDSPVGRYGYAYNDLGAQTPEAVKAALKRRTPGREIDPSALLANLVRVSLPTHYDADQKAHPYANRGVSSSSISRLYHHEDPAHPSLLTGITVSGQGSDGRQMLQRIATWAYDTHGRANLSVKGEPARLQTDASGKPIEPRRLAAGTGLEQVTLQWPRAGEVVLTNALGQETRYKTDRIAGEYRILEARGAGCASCGPTNVRYEHDKLGRLVEVTRITSEGEPIEGRRSELDAQGRPLKVSRIRYTEGKAQAPQWTTRYAYAADPDLAPGMAQPVLIATPSVIAGQEHRVAIAYNEFGQPSSITESGFSPVDAAGQAAREGAVLTRTTTYAYQTVNGRSLLQRVDGPLRNGDVTSMAWDSTGSYIVATTAPGGLTVRETHDTVTGRLASRTDANGITTNFEYAAASQARPTLIERGGRTTHYGFDALGRIAQVSDSAARQIKLHYDRADHLIAVTDAQGYRAQTTLDAQGQALVAGLYEPEQTEPLRATYRWYDRERRISKQLRADGRLDTWRYDSAGEVAQHTDGDEVMHLSQRNSGSLTARIDMAPDGLIRAALWSSDPQHAQPINTPQAKNDDFGRRVFEWRPEQGVGLSVFDAADHLVREQRLDRAAKPAGHVEQLFDSAGRLRERREFDARGSLVQTVTRTYQGARLKTQTDVAQQTEYDYDAQGRVVASKITLKDERGQPAYVTTLQSRYGSADQPDSRTLADGQVMRVQRADTGAARGITLQSESWSGVHEAAARWLPQWLAPVVQGWLPHTVVVQDIAFHPYNGITGYTLGNGIAIGREFDRAGRLTAMTDGATRTTLSYAVGPRVDAVQTIGAVGAIHTLDELRTGAGAINVGYRYDGFGALRAESSIIPAARTSLEKASAPPPSLGSVERDAQGRTTSDGTYSYAYTANGQIDHVDQGGQRVAAYRYNSQRQRVSKTAQGRTTYYLWSQGKLVAEIDGNDGNAENAENAENDANDASTDRRQVVSAQYLYLSDEGRAAPIAKLESATAQGNRTGKARLLYVQGDHRGAPTTMTDERRSVVWQARPDAWGFINAADARADPRTQQAVMNLRLPGQYFDAETGLHDNWHRSYDARPGSANKGRYLTPDPLGYPDGPDPYRYAGGDPINRLDATGLYEEDIHYYMTFFLALVAGVDYDNARTIALAAQYIDDNPQTRPVEKFSLFKLKVPNLSSVLWNQEQLLRYHFVLADHDSGSTDTAFRNNDVNIVNSSPSAQLQRLLDASNNAPNDCGRYQFFGEYLHAFEDTFSHRKKDNTPYDALSWKGGLGTGHGFADSSEPDYTFDNTNNGWDVREARTLAMEQSVFAKFTGGTGTGNAPSAEALDAVLVRFNKITESGDGPESFTQKIALLQLTLKDWGIKDSTGSEIDLRVKIGVGYDKDEAARNRASNLCEKGMRFKPSDYPGTMLPKGDVPC